MSGGEERSMNMVCIFHRKEVHIGSASDHNHMKKKKFRPIELLGGGMCQQTAFKNEFNLIKTKGRGVNEKIHLWI